MTTRRLWLVILILTASLSALNTAQARPNTSCPSGQMIQRTLSTGAVWSICWAARAQEGIVLSNVSYKAPGQIQRRVLGEISLSQIHRYYHDGAASELVVTNQGLGGSNFITIPGSECTGGTRYNSAGRAVLCERQIDSGFIYKNGTAAAVSGKALSLHSVSQIGSSNYTVNWLFHENGTIEPRIGLSGRLERTSANAAFGWPIQQNGTVGIGFTENYFWRIDVDLGSNPSNDIVEQITSALNTDRTKRSKQVAALNTEAGRNFSPEVKRFWRVRDGSETNGVTPISYELVAFNYDHQGNGANNESWLRADVTMTQYNSCERYAVGNSTANGCGSDVSKFANGENINQRDVVLWNRISYHHLPRDEDNNVIGMRWSGFKLLPRDLYIRNPL